ncbi:hypothetical protein C8Q73DRAFT_634570, partial [Cubamyces lactineus]
FKGQPHHVKEFLEQYEELIKWNNITDNQSKCKYLQWYCNCEVRELLGTLIELNTTWTNLKKKFEELFDSDQNEKQYKKSDLKRFVKEHRERWITLLAQARSYYRKFQCIAGWLKIKGIIDNKEYNKAFWKGINHSLRNKLKVRYLRAKPTHDLKEPFEVDTLVQIFNELFGRDQFDNDDSDFEEMHSSGDESDTNTSNSDTDTDTDSDGSDSKAGSKKWKPVKHKKSKKSKAMSKKSKVKKNNNNISGEKSARSNDSEDMESIIQKLQKLSIDDPSYGFLYYKAFKMDKDITQSIPQPKMGNQSSGVSCGQTTNNRGDIRCYGCSEQGHSLNNCPKIKELLLNGIMKKGDNNKYVMADGSFIQ